MTQTTDAALVAGSPATDSRGNFVIPDGNSLMQRLRAYRPTDEWGDGVHHVICDEAADTIEAQARRIEALEAIATGRWSSDARGYDLACEAIAEIKRIRAFALAALAPTKEPTP